MARIQGFCTPRNKDFCVPWTLVSGVPRSLEHKGSFLYYKILALAVVGRCHRRFDFFKTGTFFTQALAALYRLPPAGRFFEKGTLKHTRFDVVVQEASSGSICFKWTSKKHKPWRRCTGGLRRVDTLKNGTKSLVPKNYNQTENWTHRSEQVIKTKLNTEHWRAQKLLKPNWTLNSNIPNNLKLSFLS